MISRHQRIKNRFAFNLQRVHNLISLYGRVKRVTVPKPQYPEDILRSAVVLLHAALEDLLRGILVWQLSEKGSPKLKKILIDQLSGKERERDREQGQEKELIPGGKEFEAFIRKPVGDMLAEILRAHFDEKSFGSCPKIMDALETLNISKKKFEPLKSFIKPMTDRRHHIVHQSDRDHLSEDGHGTLRAISSDTVKKWAAEVTEFGNLLLKEVAKKAIIVEDAAAQRVRINKPAPSTPLRAKVVVRRPRTAPPAHALVGD